MESDFRRLPDERLRPAVVISRTGRSFDGAPVILTAMIFAGMMLIVGVLLGFLLGQARSRMSYEQELRKVEQARAALESQLGQLRGALQIKSQEQPRGAGPAGEASE